MDIPFTQYLRPSGKAVDVSFVCPWAVEGKAAELLDAGYRFEAEVLTTGEISLTVTDGEDDIAIQICPNGPQVRDAIKVLITEAAAQIRKPC